MKQVNDARRWPRIAAVLLLGAVVAGTVPAAAETEPGGAADDIWTRDTMTDGFFGLDELWKDQGVKVELLATQVYQQNVMGGRSTSTRHGHYAGSYDLESIFDLEKLFNLADAQLTVIAQGSWSPGITDSQVGSIMPVNADAAGIYPIALTEVFWDQSLFEDKIMIRLGKQDMKGKLDCQGCRVSFDGNNFANNKKRQFLNKALDHNRSIPFPDNGWGGIIVVSPEPWYYVSAGAADSDAAELETGFDTAFHDPVHLLYLAETGWLPQFDSQRGPLQGAYRVGMWYDPRPKERFGGGTQTDDAGFYLSFDQMFYRESALDPDQGFGGFARYGYANGDINTITNFWSVGAQYRGLLPGRDRDVFGAGFVQAILTNEPQAGYTNDGEWVIETYYRIVLAPWIELTPDVQYIANPGGTVTQDDALVLGCRLQMSF